MTSRRPTTTLWRPTGPVELELVRELDWRAWPPRLPEQPIFHPVVDEDYAVKIARDWNVKHDGAGFVTRFEVDSDFVRRYPSSRRAAGRSANCGCRPRSSTSSTPTSSARSRSCTSSADRGSGRR
jgi:hypothetical protein